MITSDLVRFVKARAPELCLAGAGHPEGHPETRDLSVEVEHLRAKVDAGLDVIITNMFYVNARYFAFVEQLRRAGITVPRTLPGGHRRRLPYPRPDTRPQEAPDG